MNSTTKAALVITFVIAAFLFLVFGGGMGAGTVTGFGSMGSYGSMGGGSTGGFGWMWFPGLLLIVIGAALSWAVFGER